MMYVNEPSRTALLEDTRVFIQQQTNNWNDNAASLAPG
jgi:hypothetical protein